MTPGTKQIILAGAPKTLFEADLKTTLVPNKAINGTPTFTRASAATFIDFEGLVKTVKSGEARFHGARRVENLLAGHVGTNSEDITSTNWSNVGTATRVDYQTATLAAVKDYIRYITVVSATSPTSNGAIVTASFEARSDTPNFKLGAALNDTLSWNTYSTDMFVTLTSSWVRYSFTATNSGTGTAVYLVIGDINKANASPGGTIGTFQIRKVQIEKVTGQAIQAPGDYVSTGVLSTPYHGANVDGVKYFDYANGNTVSSNVVTEARGAAISDSTLRGYLAEEQRTNLITYSDDINNAAWAKTDTTVTSNAIAAPDGNTTADLLTQGAAGTALVQSSTGSMAAGSLVSGTIYLKRGNTDYVLFQLQYVGTGDNIRAWVNLANGTIANTSNTGAQSYVISSSISSVANGFYKVTLSGYLKDTANSVFINTLAVTTTSATTRVNNGTYYAWGGQIEVGAMPTSYIPTTSATVTRAADVLNYTATNVNNDTGAVTADTYINWLGSPANNATLIGIGSGTTAGLQISTSDSPTVIRMNDGTNAITKTGLDDASTGIRRRGAMWGSKGLYAGGNGLVSTQSTFDGLVEFSTLNIGQLNGSRHLNGTIRNVKVYQKQMTLTLFTRRVTSG